MSIRIKLLKAYKEFRKGEIISLSPNEAFGLLDAGQAEVTKDMTYTDYKTASAPVKPAEAAQDALAVREDK